MSTIVTGRGDRLDLPKVQNAVNSDSEVILRGSFAFGSGTVKVTKAVTISGESGATINGGKIPLDVSAPGSVKIKGLHFVGPQQFAINVSAVKDLEISNCMIDGVLPVPAIDPNTSQPFTTAAGIVIGTQDPKMVLRATSGNLDIINNVIDIGAGAEHRTLGILLNFAGIDASRSVIAHIAGNTVRNVTGFGLDFRDLIGSATIDGRNIITIGVDANKELPVSGIRCLGSPQYAGLSVYLISNNEIECGNEKSAGIRLQCKSKTVSMDGVRVEDNQIAMSSPFGAVPDAWNAGIEIMGNCRGNQTTNNTISGKAVAALTLIQDSGVPPVSNTFRGNHHKDFTALLADISVQAGVKTTTIIAPAEFKDVTANHMAGTIKNLGEGTSFEGDYELVQ